ncbi:MAG: BlaI/MecI/CopY family transcriptional regulator [Saccharofermentans sp.]|nr:BlaI/MecI/CopY family transcriptional regulator [Saccharofermentans sp.]
MIKLSDAEWRIATCLWDNKSMTITELTKELKDETGWSKNTIITLLKRMEEKEAVHYVQEDRAKRFYPSIDRSEAEMEETTTFLDKVYSGRVGLMISNLIKSDKLTKEDIEELHKILEDK